MKYEKQNLFFISDLHIGHKNIIRFDNRPFKDLDEMHINLIEKWNSVVTDDDIVYYLGDLSFARSGLTKWFIYSLKGEINFIKGNHDKMIDILKFGRFNKIYEYGTEILVKDDDILYKRTNGYQQIILSHYPMLIWNRSNHGSFHLHGHSHSNLLKSNPEYYNRKVIDVSCNNIGYTPISYSEIKKIMSTKNILF